MTTSTPSIFPTPADKDKLLTHLKLLGIQTIKVEFSGGGDDGDINHIEPTPLMNLEEITADYAWDTSNRYDLESNQWVTTFNRAPADLHTLLKNLTFAALENTQMDWYNNEGGQGKFIIDFSTTPPNIQLDLEINTITTEDYEYTY